MTILSVVGARPNFMKVGPIHDAIEADGRAKSVVVHTGQHYDERMSGVFFRDLGLPEPPYYLGIGGGSHAEQTARVMLAFEPVLDDVSPDVVLVVGDVNSTLATALVAAKRHVPVVHVEAGLRSGDRAMPEELNRICVDHLADRLYVTEQSGLDNLSKEGIPANRAVFAGNVMIDSLRRHLDSARASQAVDSLGLDATPFALVTLHRPRNVDHPDSLRRVAEVVESLAQRLAVVLPLHPRTRGKLKEFGLLDRVERAARMIPPAGYLVFLALMDAAAVVVTDSGGIQEETTALGVPCLTLRPSTERPSTVEIGTNQLLPLDAEAVRQAVNAILSGEAKQGAIPPLWDGRAGKRIASDLIDWLGTL